MLDSARIGAVATAVPDHCLHQRDVAAEAGLFFGEAFGASERLTAIYENAAIETRYSCVPIDWYREPHDFPDKNTLYLRQAEALLAEVAERLVADAGLAMQDIDGLVVVSSTGIATPSLDALLIERLGFRPDVERLPVFGLGCAGGVIGLARTAQLAAARPGARYLCLVVELCGLTFRARDRTKSNIVATALFGDGAGGALIGTDLDGPRIGAGGSHTWPESLDVMGWDLRADGLAVIFSRDIPHIIRTKVPPVLAHFLNKNDLELGAFDQFLAHPGGAKVVDALEEVFGLEAGRMTHSRQVLRDYGNMSAATILFVLERAVRAGDRGRALLSALGPGFTAAMLVVED
jgi:alkylresorcinol/alkylpyrone synthase